MRHALRSVPAESIIESIIAITVIVIGTAAALSMLRTSVDGNELLGEKEQAIHLALEGLDAVKNIRDSNYLLHADSADSCWNTYGATVSDCSDGTAYDSSLVYSFIRDYASSSLDWSVVRTANSSSNTAYNRAYITLYGVDTDEDGNSDMELYAEPQLNTVLSSFDPQATQLFRRSMTVSYNDIDGDGIDDSFDATVTVTWVERGATHSISLTRTFAHVY